MLHILFQDCLNHAFVHEVTYLLHIKWVEDFLDIQEHTGGGGRQNLISEYSPVRQHDHFPGCLGHGGPAVRDVRDRKGGPQLAPPVEIKAVRCVYTWFLSMNLYKHEMAEARLITPV